MPKEKRHSHKSDKPVDVPKNQCLVFTQRLNIVSFSLVIVTAIIVLITAGVLYAQLKKYTSILTVTIPVGFIVISLFLLITAVIALIGIKRQLMKAVQVAIGFLLVLIIIELAIGGATYAYRNSLGQKMQSWWSSASNDERNQFQNDWSCCGFSEPHDFPGSNCIIKNGTTVQEYSTFSVEVEEENSEEMNIEEKSEEVQLDSFSSVDKQDTMRANVGCKDALIELFEKRLTPLSIVGLVFAFIQLFSLVFAVILLVVLYREKNRSYLSV